MGLATAHAFAEAGAAVVLADINEETLRTAADDLRLCSPGASFIVGVALPVDGGYTAR